MGLFSRKKYYDQSKLDIKTNPGPIKPLPPRNERLEQSLGVGNIDNLLSNYAPEHESEWSEMKRKQDLILENQKVIMEQLASLRHIYQTPEKAAAGDYSNASTR